MLWKPRISEFIRHTEDLTQPSDSVCLKHPDVHTFGDAIFDFILADIEIIVGDAAILHALIMIGYIPFPRNIKAVRKKVLQPYAPGSALDITEYLARQL